MSQPNPDALALSLLRAAQARDQPLFDSILVDVDVVAMPDIMEVLIGWMVGVLEKSGADLDTLWTNLGRAVANREVERWREDRER